MTEFKKAGRLKGRVRDLIYASPFVFGPPPLVKPAADKPRAAKPPPRPRPRNPR